MSQSVYLKVDFKQQTLELKAPAEKLKEVEAQLQPLMERFAALCEQAHNSTPNQEHLPEQAIAPREVKRAAVDKTEHQISQPKKPEMTAEQAQQKAAIYGK